MIYAFNEILQVPPYVISNPRSLGASGDHNYALIFLICVMLSDHHCHLPGYILPNHPVTSTGWIRGLAAAD